MNKKKKMVNDELAKKSKLSKKQVCSIMRDLLSAVSYIHYKKVIHKDIKMENIKFSKKGVVDHIKLIDFGSAIVFQPGELYYSMSGSPCYMAPEMLSGKGFNEKVDIWSCGVIFHFLLTG